MSAVRPAPISEDQPEKAVLTVIENIEDLRDKRSNYGYPYVSPCAAASSPVPSIAPPVSYQLNLDPVQQYMRPYTYGYNYHYPHYRSVDQNENELLSFSDVDHVNSDSAPLGTEGLPAYYPEEPRIAVINPQVAPAQSFASFGVFPYINPSALNVPFVLSCSPSIVQGQMVQAQPQYYTGYRAPDIHRNVDLQKLYEAPGHVQMAQDLATSQKPNEIPSKSL
ncbi:unnamed protein product [Parnassius apollo]|uniref:(apollo) hypothetical protein n=1 Tax=Parnassius apollo TaxID=110799 RepID=A0A8S3WXI7_PARAO|nr:unnamed protein product [Parnassius apollo]